jgi:hypothetical protein
MKLLLGTVALFAFVVVATADAVAQSGGRKGRNVGCPNGGYVNSKYYCDLKDAARR